MHIDRQTYEELFLLYNDGELNMEERRAVEEFIKENPDLEQELIMLQGAVFTPDETIVFDNKELLYRKERRVISFYWMRVAAAAAVILVLTIAGSIYLGEKDDQPKNNLASRELIKESSKSEANREMTKTEPQVTTVSETTAPPSTKLGETASHAVLKLIKTPVIKNATQQTEQPASEQGYQVETSSQPVLEPANIEHELVDNTSAAEGITATVLPQQIEQETAFSAGVENKIVYAEEEDNNMIYFANTSLPKKTKLRGVFRKATRILDKVTSFQ